MMGATLFGVHIRVPEFGNSHIACHTVSVTLFPLPLQSWAWMRHADRDPRVEGAEGTKGEALLMAILLIRGL